MSIESENVSSSDETPQEHKQGGSQIKRIAVLSGGIVGCLWVGRELSRRFRRREGQPASTDLVESPPETFSGPDMGVKVTDGSEAEPVEEEFVSIPSYSESLIDSINNFASRKEQGTLSQEIVEFLQSRKFPLDPSMPSIDAAVLAENIISEEINDFLKDCEEAIEEDISKYGFSTNVRDGIGNADDLSVSSCEEELEKRIRRGVREYETDEDYDRSIESLTEDLEAAYIRANGLKALEDYLYPAFPSTPEMLDRDSLKISPKFEGLKEQDPQQARNFIEFAPDDPERVSNDEYAARVSGAIASMQTAWKPQIIEGFDRMKDALNYMGQIQRDPVDQLATAKNNTHDVVEDIAEDILKDIAQDAEEIDEKKKERKYAKAAGPFAVLALVGAAGVVGGWLLNEMLEDDAQNSDYGRLERKVEQSLSDVEEGQREVLAAVDNALDRFNKIEQRMDDLEDNLRESLDDIQEEIEEREVSEDRFDVKLVQKLSSQLTDDEAREYLDNSDGLPDAHVNVVIDKDSQPAGIDTVDWALNRTIKSGLFHPENPSINGAERWAITSAAIKDQNRLPESYHWVSDGDLVSFNIGQNLIDEFQEANVPVSVLIAVPRDDNSGEADINQEDVSGHDDNGGAEDNDKEDDKDKDGNRGKDRNNDGSRDKGGSGKDTDKEDKFDQASSDSKIGRPHNKNTGTDLSSNYNSYDLPGNRRFINVAEVNTEIVPFPLMQRPLFFTPHIPMSYYNSYNNYWRNLMISNFVPWKLFDDDEEDDMYLVRNLTKAS